MAISKTDILEEARAYFIPFLLGDNSASHRLSRSIYRKYKITSLILDVKMTPLDVFDTSSKFLRIADIQSPELFAYQLIDLAQLSEYTLPLLIPCNEKYASMLKAERELLESTFVITSPELLLTSSPLGVIPL